MTLRALCAFIFLLPMPLLQAAGETENSACRALKLSEKVAGNNRIYRLNDTVSFSIGYDSALDTRNDYGARLMLLKQSAGVFSRIFYSKGSSDSYGMRPTFIANCGGNELLVFGEMGTEYSWGLRVFAYNDGDMHDLGTIPFAIEGDVEAASVIPYMRFTLDGHSAIVSFTKDLIQDPGSIDEKRVPQRSISYRIDRNNLTKIQP